jgi:hypothetical protein
LLAIQTVPASRKVRRHNFSDGIPQAVDVYAPTGSRVLAPLPGQVRLVSCPDTPALPGCQIRGFLRLPGGGGMPFVLAHLRQGTFPTNGMTFQKGATLGRVEFWEQHPNSSHVHWAFRNPGDTRMPPPANISIVRAFELCGPAPRRAEIALAVSEIDAEDLPKIDTEDLPEIDTEVFDHGPIEVLEEEFEFDADAFEQGDFDAEVLDEED